MIAYRQGKTRKGSYAAYMDVSHPDIEEFLSVRIPTGDVGRKCLNLHNAVNVTNEFMQAVKQGKEWHLKDPNDGTIRETMPARKLWEKILEVRFRTGEPYVNFIDTANKYLPETQKKLGLKIHGSNLCNEIHLATSEERTAVCCLSSLNLEMYDDWKDTNIVRDLIRFLDNVLQFFIDHAPDDLSKARYSASQERSLGLGAMGYHSYLQKHRIPFEKSDDINKEIFEHVQHEAVEESLLLGKERGEAPDMKGTGRRNAHLLAIAPNANSSMIVSTSPSIEPHKANAYTHRTRAGSHLIKNKYLAEVLDGYDMNKSEVWTGIITNGGSVQHLQFLADHEKEVFKTAVEIDQVRLVELGGQRQKYLCQGQSLNVFFPAGASKKYLTKTHIKAWENECKGLYYLRTEVSNRAENVSQKVELNKLRDYQDIKKEEDDCINCQG
jgi:ribonucleoside-diphosphate reductase alpha chain